MEEAGVGEGMICVCCGRGVEPQPSHLEMLIWCFPISRKKKILSKLLSFCEISFAEDWLDRYCCQSLPWTGLFLPLTHFLPTFCTSLVQEINMSQQWKSLEVVPVESKISNHKIDHWLKPNSDIMSVASCPVLIKWVQVLKSWHLHWSGSQAVQEGKLMSAWESRRKHAVVIGAETWETRGFYSTSDFIEHR